MAFRTRTLCSALMKSLKIGESTSQMHLWSSARSTGVFQRPLVAPVLFSNRPHLIQQKFSSSDGSRPYSAAGETNLVSFLNEEIEAEKQHARQNFDSDISQSFNGFTVAKDSAEIKLTKTFNSEKITVTFNVNNTVDAIDSGAVDGEIVGEEQANAPMIARPPFLVEIQKGEQKLAFDCQIVDAPEMNEAGEPGDLFSIEELYVYEGELNDKVYASSASVIDGTLYDHLMGYLEERGIDNKFAETLVKAATHHEHTEYVSLLHKIKDFVAK